MFLYTAMWILILDTYTLLWPLAHLLPWCIHFPCVLSQATLSCRFYHHRLILPLLELHTAGNHFMIFFHTVFLKLFFKDAFVFSKREREGEREGEKHQCVIASCTAPTRNLAHNTGICPIQESNWQPIRLQAGTQSTEPHQPGLIFSILTMNTMFLTFIRDIMSINSSFVLISSVIHVVDGLEFLSSFTCWWTFWIVCCLGLLCIKNDCCSSSFCGQKDLHLGGLRNHEIGACLTKWVLPRVMLSPPPGRTLAMSEEIFWLPPVVAR